MAADPAPKTETSPNPEEDWDESRLQCALERLQEMHIHLRELRDTIPSIVRPVHSEYNSPEELYSEFRSRAIEAVGDVRQFKALMRDGKSKDLLARAKASKNRDGEGIETWLVDQHANWLHEPAVRSAKDLKTEDDLDFPAFNEKEVLPGPDQTPIDQIVKSFKEKHPDITVNLQEAISNILLTLPSPAKLTFSISWNPNNPSNKNFEVSTKGPNKLHTNVNQGLIRRAKKDDLYWTLEMLAEYINVKQQRCDQCHQLHDSENNFAGVKEGKLSDPNNAWSPIHWESYHLNCLSAKSQS